MFAASKTSRRATAALPDPFFDNVTTLLESSGTNGAQNNTFIDSSTNNFTITRNGNTTQGAFSPFGENWSNYFDGTGDYLNVASNAAFGYGTGAFTIECWFNTSSIPPSGAAYLFDQRTTGSQAALLTYINPSAALEVVVNAAVVITGGVVTVGTWNHFALSRSGTTTRMFLNGVQVGSSWTDSNNYGNLPVVIAARFSTTENFLTGYISNFRIIKGTALYTANFTPSTVPLQPVQNTSLLTCRDGNIVDDSANNFTITRNGNVSVQKFGPFAATTLPTPYYGAFFDGNGDYITAPANTVFQLTGDFTLEAWIYPTTVNSFNMVFGSENGANSDYMTIRASTLDLAIANASYPSWSFSFTAGNWYHIAVTRSSTTLRAFVNGVALTLASGSATNSAQMFQSGAPIAVGRYGNTSNPLNFTGYISNARIVKGQALYTSNFTPSTAPLTTTSQGATASNVSLLTCQSTRFIDNSTNNFAITAFGDSRPTIFAPFSVAYLSQQAYTPSVFGGSMYFDGNGDSLTTTNSYTFGTAAFTIECWINPTAYPSSLWAAICGNITTGTGDTQIVLSIKPSGAVGFLTWNNWIIDNTTVIAPLNVWTHVAIAFDGTTYRLFLNGGLVGTSTTVRTLSTPGPFNVGFSGNTGIFNFSGYVSSLRVIQGTALYTSRFVPQNTPLTSVTNTSLLLNATNAGIYDASTINDFETVGNAQVNTSVKKYGLSSIAFDGAGDYLLAPSNPSMDFTANFTIEMWVNFVNVNSTWQSIISRAYGVAGGWRLYKNDGNNQLRWYSNLTSVVLTTGSTLANNTWSHIALVRNNGVITIYIDGISRGSASNTTSYVPGNYALEIGQGVVTSAFPMNGYIQDLRITNGIARYTTNFTPPTALFPEF
jgi:hypothetical protein